YVVRNSIQKGDLAALQASPMDANDDQSVMAAASDTNNRNTEATEESIGTKPNADSKQQPRRKASNKAVSYSVKKSDTLSSIARKHGTTVEKLCRLNGLKPTSILRIGQAIKCS
ncbi:MAG: LysM peptidoglycan-binding domain-containing protein, partial [Bacteroidaceae bacterium]|nr:LysM peptidoglycan-binding domain-containing protein [Bacteroidaceae bacterium]